MLKLRQIGAPRIVPSGRVVLEHPYATSDGVVVGHALPEGGVVVKIHKKTLKEVWRKEQRLKIRGGYGDLIFLYYGQEAQVWNNDGRVLWKPDFSFVIGRGRLFRFSDGKVATFDAYTGKMLDSVACPVPSYPKLVLEDEGVVMVGDQLETDPVRAFDLRARRVLWERNIRAEIRGQYGDQCERGIGFLCGGPGRLIAGSGRHVFGLSALNGELRWGVRLGIADREPEVKDGRLYAWATSGESARHVAVLDSSLGQVTHETVTPSSAENRFVILDEATGEILMDRPLAPYGAPFRHFQEPRGTLCKNHIAFTTSDTGLLAVFRLSDGELVWQYEHPEELFRAVFDDNRLYVRCADGTLVVFEAEGEEL